jgi:Homeodomain-like domain
MERVQDGVVSPLNESGLAEERMLGAEMVREMVARRERGQGVKRIARELGVDRKTVKRWLKLGVWQPRQTQRRARELDRFAEFLKQRAPEVGWNGAVLYRELQAMGFTGGLVQVQRFVRPYREERKWSELATVRFETGPGEQAQVDYGQLWVWIGTQFGEGPSVRVHPELFAPALFPRLSERTADNADRRPRARVWVVWRSDAELSVR